jgi:hypothetical protein
MDLEKQWLEAMKEAVDMEPVNNMGKWGKQTKLESIAEKLDWIGKVKKQAEGGYDTESGIDKDAWIKGYIYGFAEAAEALNSLAENEENEEGEEETEGE